MKNWSHRPIEVRNLFNPAFCGLLLARSVFEFQKEGGDAIPYSLTLLIPPLCLYKETREIFVKNSRSYFLKVVQENPQIIAGLGPRTRAIMPYIQEGFALLMNRNCIHVTSEGCIEAIPRSIRQTILGTEESRSCQSTAKYLGRQFARIGDKATIFATLGVRP